MKYDALILQVPTVDIVVEMEGEYPIDAGVTRIVKSFAPEPGGAGNIVYAFTHMGGKMLHVGAVGNDYYGNFIIETYRDGGIATEGIEVVENYQTSRAICVVDETGKHSFISLIATCHFTTEPKLEEQLAQCRSVVASGYSLVEKDGPMVGLTLALARMAAKAGKPVFFDPGPLVRDIDPEVLAEMLKLSTVVSVNEHECQKLSGRTEHEEGALALAKMCGGIVLAKSGSRGCFTVAQGEGKWYPGYQVPLVDTMGAGDSFLGAFMHGHLCGWDLATCVRFANAAGAVATSKLGTGRQVPNFGEMAALLEANGHTLAGNDKKNGKFSQLRL